VVLLWWWWWFFVGVWMAFGLQQRLPLALLVRAPQQAVLLILQSSFPEEETATTSRRSRLPKKLVFWQVFSVHLH
jgi:hypothetical protein